MIAILPVSLVADDAGAGILHSSGGVLINGNNAPETATIFPGDTIQIQSKGVARIEVTGSTVDLTPDTIVQYESDEVHLDHGSVSVNTSQGYRVRVSCLIVVPVNTEEWTRYDVSDTDGKVKVAAIKSDVNIDARSGNPRSVKQSAKSGRVTVREGEEKSREEKCGAGDYKSAIAARGAILNSPYVQYPALGVIGGVACLALCRTDDPLSPSHP